MNKQADTHIDPMFADTSGVLRSQVAELKSAGLKPKKKQKGVPGIEAGTQTFEIFSHDFFVRQGHGIQILRHNNSEINVNSDITASISEMTANDVPFIGLADMRILGVAAFDGGAFIKVDVIWSEPLRFQVMLIYSTGRVITVNTA